MRSPRRITLGSLLAAICTALVLLSTTYLFAPKGAEAARNERTITLYEIHLKETTTVTYKRDGKFIPEGLKKLNWALRDWRRNVSTKMNPKLIDLVWQLHKDSGSKKPIHVISGYRSPKTNRMLRRTRGGQAKRSQHMLGNAMDIHLPDVSMSEVRKLAFKHEIGGVGYYPTSAIPFIHVDTARVRSWPRMTRRQLAMVFPYGKTRHRPSRGGPLTLRDQKKARIRLAQLARKKKARTLLAQVKPAPLPGAAAKSAGTKIAAFAPMDIPGVGRHRKNLWFYAMDGSSDLQAQLKTKPLQTAQVQRKAQRKVQQKPQAKAQPQLKAMKPLTNVAGSAPASTPPVSKPKGPSMRDKIQLASLTAPISNTVSRLGRHAANLWSNRNGAAPAPARQGGDDAPHRSELIPVDPVKPVDAPAPALVATNDTPAAPAESGLKRMAALTPAAEHPAADSQSYRPERVAYAPAFDEEHPDELSYRPFQIMPLMTAEPIVNNTRLVAMQEPKHDRVLELLAMSENLSMQFRPSPASAQMRWMDQFTGDAILILRKQAESSHTMRKRTRLAQRQ